MILDVGCGYRPQGEVNVDISRTPNETTYPKTTKRPRNFILATGEHLPFQDQSFDEVLSDNSMEHTDHYREFFLELLRVAKRKVVIKVPHRFSRFRPAYHKVYFTATWFKNALKTRGISNYKIDYTRFTRLPYTFFPLIRLPAEITVTIYLS